MAIKQGDKGGLKKIVQAFAAGNAHVTTNVNDLRCKGTLLWVEIKIVCECMSERIKKRERDFGAAGSALDWRSIGPWFESEKSQTF